jgi:hypothetical protein
MQTDEPLGQRSLFKRPTQDDAGGENPCSIRRVSVFVLKEALTLNHVIGFAFIAFGAFFVFRGAL